MEYKLEVWDSPNSAAIGPEGRLSEGRVADLACSRASCGPGVLRTL
jgi:hypothetical protein